MCSKLGICRSKLRGVTASPMCNSFTKPDHVNREQGSNFRESQFPYAPRQADGKLKTAVKRKVAQEHDSMVENLLLSILQDTAEGVEYDSDPLHVRQIVRDLDLLGSKPVAALGPKPTFDRACQSKLLPPEKMRPFRAIAARANCFDVEWPDMQFPPKEICSWMSAPTGASVVAMKRLGRYFEGCPRLRFKYTMANGGESRCLQ